MINRLTALIIIIHIIYEPVYRSSLWKKIVVIDELRVNLSAITDALMRVCC